MNNTVVDLKPAGALTVAHSNGRMDVADILSHVATVQAVMKAVMKPEVHYGIVPGTNKPSLYKPGAEVLCMVFRISPSYQVEELSTADTVRYRVTCSGTHQLSGTLLGTGMGEASSAEEKYKWRKAYDNEFNATPENMRRRKQGWDKQKKAHYDILQVRTESADLANTILKMANKRAMLAMVLNVTAASDCFTQDMEDMEEKLRAHLAAQDNGGEPPPPAEPTPYPDDTFKEYLPIWKKAIAKGQKPEDVINKVNSLSPTTPLTDAQKDAIRALAKADKPAITFADIAAMLAKAKNADELNTANDLIKEIPDAAQKAELRAKYDNRAAELAGTA